MTSRPCRVCGSDAEHPTFTCREMMFGTREQFEYFQCRSCGCLQISTVPGSLAKYYPTEFSAHNLPKEARPPTSRIWGLVRKQRFRIALFQKYRGLNRLLRCFVDSPAELHDTPNDVTSVLEVLTKAGVSGFNARVLDVGCGAYSYWLASLEGLGFTNLVGIDPLISKDERQRGVRILKKELAQVSGQFDLITLHHSLEHIPDQIGILSQVAERLAPRGVCVIRIPIVSSRIWEEYGTDWVELDAPRHLYLHSRRSMSILSRSCGLEIFDVMYDSTAFEFYGSELYRNDIPLTDERSPWRNADSDLFSPQQMAEFQARALAANREGKGGRAAFFLRHRSVASPVVRHPPPTMG